MFLKKNRLVFWERSKYHTAVVTQKQMFRAIKRAQIQILYISKKVFSSFGFKIYFC